MRSSNVCVLGIVAVASLAACSVSTTKNSITFKTQTEFVDSSQPAKTSTADWAGEAITIQNGGVNPLTGTGGIVIQVDPNATKVTAKAIFAARADDDAHKADADASIADALQTFTLTESGGAINIQCGHGSAHGTSGVASSGCKLLTVTIPPGSAAQPHALKVGDGNGGISFSGNVFASSLAVTENGEGDVDVKVTPTKGTRVVVTGGNAVVVRLPADFSSQMITLNAEGATSDADKAKRILTADFPDMVNGKSFPTTGATADAASEINVQTTGLLDDYTVSLKKQ